MVGRTLAHYEITAKLGEGGMGEVWRARDTRLDREVAVKVLPAEIADHPGRFERFDREARAIAALNHPSIVTIYSVEEVDGVHLLTMELIEGESLDHGLPAGGFGLDTLFPLAIQIADALAAAHDKGIVHRDLKPANVMVGSDGRVKVLDFGLAKLVEPEEEEEEATQLLTRDGMILGTVPYMSPEQVQGKAVDHRSDIFSLGILLYEMATGRRPFTGDNSASVLSAVLKDQPQSITELKAELPNHLGRIIHRCLEKDPERRYQSAKEVRNELEALREEVRLGSLSGGRRAVAVGSSAPASSTSRAALWVGLGAAGLVAALAAGLWLGGSGDAPEEPLRRELAAAESDYPSVAVLPFVDLSPDRDQGYFADGLSEELLSTLAQIRDLKVTGRTSSFRFRDRTEDLRTVGEQLGVSSILEGSVRKAGDRWRITAQLVNAADGFQLWSESYDRTLGDVFAVQDEISSAVAAALQVTLLGGSAGEGRAGSRDPEAYNLYLLGQHFGRLTSEEDLEKAVGYFEQALSLEEEFPEAWAGLAKARIWQAYQAFVSFDEGFRLAREAAKRAIELDEGLASGWAALGEVRVSYDRDWEGAELALARARTLAPNDATALLTASSLSAALGRSDQAIAFARRAVELDPLSTAAHYRLGINLMEAGRLDEARAAFLEVLELQPQRDGLRLRMGIVELARSRPEAALAQMDQEVAPHWRVYGRALAYHALGRRDEADAALRQMRETWGDDAAFQLAEIHAYREELDEAFAWLERSYDHRDPGLQDVKVSLFLANLHDDPRWAEFLQKLGLPV